jgi:hypothetical protein
MRAIREMHLDKVETDVHSRRVKDNPARSLVKMTSLNQLFNVAATLYIPTQN